ncbi:arylesterase [Psychromonas sp. RZ22]|uniref:arylesterase n=1 Tax=Psychromonas algarum TaxID=2555643 RepID=UPI001067E8CB|nr:arylesterase [Psychromonas sp. RZ22]TEW56102.1 arylesterase [Psychromonas sp. RZ22]
MKIIFTLLFCFLLTACGSSEKLTPLNHTQPILAFGDSLTFGYGAKKNQSYPAQLSKLLNIDVINEGISGETSDRGLKRLASLLDRYQPQLIILCHGANDMLQKQSLQVMKNNLSQMIAMAQERDIQIVLISVPEASLFLPDLIQYQELSEQYNIPLENDIIKDVLKKPSLRSDMIHPNAQGYGLIAQAIYKLLEDNGALN